MKTHTHVQTHTHYTHNSCIMLCHLISTYFTEVLILTSDLTDINLHCNIKCTSQVPRFSAEFFIHCTMLPAFYPLANKSLCFILVKYFYLHTEVFFNRSSKRLLQNISSTLRFFRQLKKTSIIYFLCQFLSMILDSNFKVYSTDTLSSYAFLKLKFNISVNYHLE